MTINHVLVIVRVPNQRRKMATNKTWREQIEALPESEFPYVRKWLKNDRVFFTDRADMLAGYEWYAANGKGNAVEMIDTDTFGIVTIVAIQWENRKEEMARAA